MLTLHICQDFDKGKKILRHKEPEENIQKEGKLMRKKDGRKERKWQEEERFRQSSINGIEIGSVSCAKMAHRALLMA
jgi:hypothetical protein